MLRSSLVLGLVFWALAAPAHSKEAAGEGLLPSPRPTPIPAFTEQTLETLSKIPVQSEGRVKPLSTYAGFTMLKLYHKRSLEIDDERRIGPVEWWLRTVLFPARAVEEKIIRIEDSDVLDQIRLSSLKSKKKKRDVYSYAELEPGMPELTKKYREYINIDSRDQTRDQKMILTLAHKMFTFEDLWRTFMFAKLGVELPTDELQERFGGRERIPLSEALASLQEVIESGEEPGWARALAGSARDAGQRSGRLRLMAPMDAEDGLRADWYAVVDIVDSVLARDRTAKTNIAYLANLEKFYAARGSAAALEKAVLSLHEDARARAESSNAYDKIELEVTYYKLDLFGRALVIFLLGFLLLAVSWLRPQSMWIRRGLWAVGITGALVITAGIVLRCILRGRPPVSTLYETILFITGAVVISALVIEWINKRRVGMAAAITLGALGLFIAGRYEAIDRKDTMPQLLAVLDTNFWLATHVTCITLGYAAGLLAAGIAHVYVLGKAFGFKKKDPEFYRGVGRMVYGTIGFSLVFSVVGTILGGVWANDSWGRFWGWDPKENGALMIVLSQLAIIHSRLGGYLKSFGISMAAIAGGMIIAFSWWGVNLLGIGLHAYGFTEGLQRALNIFYLVEGLVLVFGGSVWLYDRLNAPRAAA